MKRINIPSKNGFDRLSFWEGAIAVIAWSNPDESGSLKNGGMELTTFSYTKHIYINYIICKDILLYHISLYIYIYISISNYLYREIVLCYIVLFI